MATSMPQMPMEPQAPMPMSSGVSGALSSLKDALMTKKKSKSKSGVGFKKYTPKKATKVSNAIKGIKAKVGKKMKLKKMKDTLSKKA
jgi:hypothetical protein